MWLCFDDYSFEGIVGEILTLAVETTGEVFEGWDLWGILRRSRYSFRGSNDRFPE